MTEEQLARQLAIRMYSAWQRARRLKTPWEHISPIERGCWDEVAKAALVWIDDYLEEQQQAAG